MSKSRRGDNLLLLLVLGGASWLVIHLGNDYLRGFEDETPSESHESASNGYLKHGKRLPSAGPNFETYSRLGSLIGRTYVHDKVRDAVIATYDELYDLDPSLYFIYGETGWPEGGEFYPHRTHQNGLVVDFMVPVRKNGAVAVIPHTIFHGFGYTVEFNKEGRLDEMVIDFDAIALHLLTLKKHARESGLRIKKIILAPELQKLLFEAENGREVKQLRFNKAGVWVRHDDHYHVEFEIE